MHTCIDVHQVVVHICEASLSGLLDHLVGWLQTSLQDDAP